MRYSNLQVLELGLTGSDHELVSAASRLIPLLRENAQEADSTRRLPARNIEALRAAGLFRLSTPRVFGGHAIGIQAGLAVLAELGRGCASTSWVSSLFYSGGLLGGLLDDSVRTQIWGSNPDAVLCGAISVPLRASRTDGGYVLNGRWGWISGIHHADWVGLDITWQNPDGGVELGLALVPVSEVSIEDTWHMVGMRGTGSDTAVADNVFVAEEYVLSLAKHAAGGYQRRGEPLSWAPITAVMLSFIAPLLGIGMAVYDQVVDKLVAGRRNISSASSHPLAIDVPGVQANVAEATMLLDSATMHATRAARDIDQATLSEEALDPLVNARLRVDISFAARQVRRAVDLLLDVGGASGFAEGSASQRLWRDLGTASRHPAVAMETNREPYARLLLGRPL